jgi:hypothetical protein
MGGFFFFLGFGVWAGRMGSHGIAWVAGRQAWHGLATRGQTDRWAGARAQAGLEEKSINLVFFEQYRGWGGGRCGWHALVRCVENQACERKSGRGVRDLKERKGTRIQRARCSIQLLVYSFRSAPGVSAVGCWL